MQPEETGEGLLQTYWNVCVVMNCRELFRERAGNEASVSDDWMSDPTAFGWVAGGSGAALPILQQREGSAEVEGPGDPDDPRG